jgi:hypothetical protein
MKVEYVSEYTAIVFKFPGRSSDSRDFRVQNVQFRCATAYLLVA